MFIKTKQLDKPENGGPIIHPQFEQFDNCKHKYRLHGEVIFMEQEQNALPD